jgi:predicted kinase
MTARLIVLSGLPGTGKSTIARALAIALAAVHVRVDTIEQACRASGMLKGEVGPAGYIVAYGVAADNLRIGRTVIADSVNPLLVTREAWRSVAEREHAAVAVVELVCSDPAEHRRRVETRVVDVPGLRLPTWDDVVNRQYEAWTEPRIVIDTARLDPPASVAEIIRRLRLGAERQD